VNSLTDLEKVQQYQRLYKAFLFGQAPAIAMSPLPPGEIQWLLNTLEKVLSELERRALDTEALKEQWRVYLDTMPPDTRRYSAQYVEEAIKYGTLHTLWLPPSDPL